MLTPGNSVVGPLTPKNRNLDGVGVAIGKDGKGKSKIFKNA